MKNNNNVGIQREEEELVVEEKPEEEEEEEDEVGVGNGCLWLVFGRKSSWALALLASERTFPFPFLIIHCTARKFSKPLPSVHTPTHSDTNKQYAIVHKYVCLYVINLHKLSLRQFNRHAHIARKQLKRGVKQNVHE